MIREKSRTKQLIAACLHLLLASEFAALRERPQLLMTVRDDTIRMLATMASAIKIRDSN